jgi:hypothetical protein
MAQDFGLLLNEYVSFGNADGDGTTFGGDFEYKTGIVPRFSKIINDNSSFFISASINAGYKDGFYVTPELLRTEYSFNSGSLGFRIGRFLYADPLAFIVSGLLDGVQLTHASSLGRFGVGAWYTGLLYKNNANINITENDRKINSVPFKYDDFGNTYFAPRRLFASLDYDHPSIGESLRLQAAVAGQFDLSPANVEEKLNSQYLILKIGVPASALFFELGGSLAAMQSTVPGADDSFNLAYAGEFGMFWTIPSGFRSRLSFNARITSGFTGDDSGEGFVAAFVPVTDKFFGEIFQARMSSLSVLSINYSARFARTVGANITASYFIRHDVVTNIYPFGIGDKDKFLLGSEIFARIVWSPFSDLQLNLGGGTFIPATGNVWRDEKPVWKIDLSAVLAIL